MLVMGIWHPTAWSMATGPLAPPQYALGQVQIATMQPFGQSFTATSSTITSIGLLFLNMNMDVDMSRDHFVDLTLYDGADFSAPVLASSRVNVDSVIGTSQFATGPVYFSVGSVPVAVGTTYSFELKAATARFGVYWPGRESYDGGNALFFGAPIDADLHFAVMSAVPEPMAATLLVAGCMLLVAAVRRQRL